VSLLLVSLFVSLLLWVEHKKIKCKKKKLNWQIYKLG
jgi:hypothetical protein